MTDFAYDITITFDGGEYHLTGKADITIQDNYPFPDESVVCHWWKAEHIDAPDGETHFEAFRKAHFVDKFRELVKAAIETQYETATTPGHEPCDVAADK